MNHLTKNQRKLVVDVVLLILFLFLNPDFPFVLIPLHEMAGFVTGIVLVVHVAFNWKWVVAMSRRVFHQFGELPRRTRIDYVLNVAMTGLFVVALISGISISTLLGTNPSAALVAIHHETASLTVLLMLVHIVRHRKWLWANLQKVIIRPSAAKQLV